MSTKKVLLKRQMTFCSKTFYRENGKIVRFPTLTLTGKWLKESGFKIGQVVDIQYEKTQLIITVAENQRFELKD